MRTEFGSARELAEAHSNYTESLVECYSVVISKSEEAAKEDVAKTVEKTDKN